MGQGWGSVALEGLILTSVASIGLGQNVLEPGGLDQRGLDEEGLYLEGLDSQI